MPRIEHVAVWCRDIEKTKSFFEHYFGCKVNKRYTNLNTGFESYFLSFEDHTRLEVMQRPDVGQTTSNSPSRESFGYAHIAVAVGSEEEVDRLTRTLARDGYSIDSGPRRTGDGYYESVVFDSDGLRVEITV
jgi:lactoylglutathione lyase